MTVEDPKHHKRALYIDTESSFWVGPPPGLGQEIIEIGVVEMDLVTLKIDPPSEVVWANGVLAESQDYFDHLSDTHTWVSTEKGLEVHIFPHLVADVRYDPLVGVWVLDGAGPAHVSLEVVNPDAPDDELIAALYTYVVVFKARIHR